MKQGWQWWKGDGVGWQQWRETQGRHIWRATGDNTGNNIRVVVVAYRIFAFTQFCSRSLLARYYAITIYPAAACIVRGATNSRAWKIRRFSSSAKVKQGKERIFIINRFEKLFFEPSSPFWFRGKGREILDRQGESGRMRFMSKFIHRKQNASDLVWWPEATTAARSLGATYHNFIRFYIWPGQR